LCCVFGSFFLGGCFLKLCGDKTESPVFIHNLGFLSDYILNSRDKCFDLLTPVGVIDFCLFSRGRLFEDGGKTGPGKYICISS
jgi:hypothetical protein